MNRLAHVLAPFAAAATIAAAAATAATAQSVLPDVPDTDGSGSWSLSELQAIWTDLTDEVFFGIDSNGDGAVDAAELQAAIDYGVLVAPETDT
jgi:hypothetical protein